MLGIDWKNGQSGGTAISAENLKLMQELIEQAINTVQNNVDKIVESGSNTNGSYTKFSDGTMICRGNKTINVAMNTAWGSMFAGNYNSAIDFPAEFVEKPQLTMNADGNNLSCSIIGVQYTASKITSIGCARGSSATGSVEVHYIAIGRWEE